MDKNPAFSLSLFLLINREAFFGHEKASAEIQEDVRTYEEGRRSGKADAQEKKGRNPKDRGFLKEGVEREDPEKLKLLGKAPFKPG